MVTTVMMVRSPRCSVSVHWDSLIRKRRLIWRNEARNGIIVALARALALGNSNLLRGRNIKVPGANTLNWRCSQKVKILVECVEHGRELFKLLPHWSLWHSVPDDPALDNGGPDVGRIVTLVYALRNALDCDVLIRTTGGSGGLRLCGVPGSAPLGIIDFADEMDARTAADTDARIREYGAKGWRVYQ